MSGVMSLGHACQHRLPDWLYMITINSGSAVMSLQP